VNSFQKAIENPPKGCVVSVRNTDFSILAQHKDPFGILLISFSCMWIGGILFFFSKIHLWENQLSLAQSAFGAMLFLISFALFIFGVILYFGKVHINKKGDHLEISTRVGKFGEKHLLSWKSVNSMSARESKWEFSKDGIELAAQNEILHFGTLLSNKHQHFVLIVLQHFFNAESFKNSVHAQPLKTTQPLNFERLEREIAKQCPRDTMVKVQGKSIILEGKHTSMLLIAFIPLTVLFISIFVPTILHMQQPDFHFTTNTVVGLAIGLLAMAYVTFEGALAIAGKNKIVVDHSRIVSFTGIGKWGPKKEILWSEISKIVETKITKRRSIQYIVEISGHEVFHFGSRLNAAQRRFFVMSLVCIKNEMERE
jgi:hypothetical protein